MLPLKFKSVCPKSGVEILYPELEVRYTPYKGKIASFAIELGDENFIFYTDAIPEIFQSTGLKDAKGAEIYFCDVLVKKDSSELYKVAFGASQGLYCNPFDKKTCFVENFEENTFFLVGNQYEDLDVLKERAKNAE